MQINYEKLDAGPGVGLGIFAAEDIPRNTLIWRYTRNENVIEYDEVAAYRHLSQKTFSEAQHWLDMTYGLNGKICEILDDGKYMNHSTTPNCKTDEIGNTYAITDIKIGDQFFEDYSVFDHPYFLIDLLKKYDCAPHYYTHPTLLCLTVNENSDLDRSDTAVDRESNMILTF